MIEKWLVGYWKWFLNDRRMFGEWSKRWLASGRKWFRWLKSDWEWLLWKSGKIGNGFDRKCLVTNLVWVSVYSLSYIEWTQWVFTITVSVYSEGWNSRSSWARDSTNTQGMVMKRMCWLHAACTVHAMPIGDNGVCLTHNRNIWSHALEYPWLLLSYIVALHMLRSHVSVYGDETFSNIWILVDG